MVVIWDVTIFAVSMDFEKIAKYLSGEMACGEKERFLSELTDDYAGLDEFALLKNLWTVRRTRTQVQTQAQARTLTADKKTVREAWRFFNRQAIRRGKSYLWQRIAAVALLVVTVGVTAYFSGRQSVHEPPVSYATLSVPAGQYAKAVLPDGSEIWLNSKSSLTYPDRFAADKREVQLNGEGFFKVVSDRQHPFVVITKDMEVTATGTQFNVSAYDNDAWTSTNLMEGAVAIRSEQHGLSHALKAGEAVVLYKEHNKLYLKASDIDEISWTKGEFRFREMSLEDIAKRLERNFNVTIVFEDQRLKNRRLTGAFYHHQSIENILKAIQKSIKQASYRIDRNMIFLGSAARRDNKVSNNI